MGKEREEDLKQLGEEQLKEKGKREDGNHGGSKEGCCGS